MNTYLTDLTTTLARERNPQQAGPMSAYMRGQFPYLGIKSPRLKEIMQGFIAKNGVPPVEHLPEILVDLWDQPEREYQYVGIGLLRLSLKKLPDDFIQPIEDLITHKSWWDTVDSIATGPVGEHFRANPALATLTLPKWRAADNIWLRRTAILHQLAYKRNTNFALLEEIINENLGSREFFINKAIGWALRAYSQTDAEAVIAFVARTELNSLSKREALKWLERRNAHVESK